MIQKANPKSAKEARSHVGPVKGEGHFLLDVQVPRFPGIQFKDRYAQLKQVRLFAVSFLVDLHFGFALGRPEGAVLAGYFCR